MQPPQANPADVSPTRARPLTYVFSVLAAVSFLNYYDRNVINITLQAIKTSLQLSDGQVGLLAGPAFAVVYCLLGVPIARLADRGRRVKVLTASLALWSLMTSACGFATSLLTMFLARLGVGLGEAGGLPTTHALVAEYFPVDRRASALSAIAFAASLGVMAGVFFGGLLVDSYGWRTAFWVAGVPGIVLAGIVISTLAEPGRHQRADAVVGATLSDATRTMWRRRSFVYLCAGIGVIAIGDYAIATWTPTFLMRAYHLSAGELGTRYSLLTGIPAGAGMLAGGLIVDRWAKRDMRAYVWILIATFAISIPLVLGILLSHGLTLTFGIVVVSGFVSALWVGPSYALVQGLAGSRMRSTAAALFMLIVNLIGLGVGPWAGGALSDRLEPSFGAESLRYALCLMLVFEVIGIVLLARATATVTADLREAALD